MGVPGPEYFERPATFEARPHKTGPQSQGYSAQKKEGNLSSELVRKFKERKRAWVFFESQPPSYRKAAAWWVMQGKRAETRERRFAKLLEFSMTGKRLG
jgi:uncharacterized protein YdeI (YjbR/CyaY-like superfamily)